MINNFFKQEKNFNTEKFIWLSKYAFVITSVCVFVKLIFD